MKKSDARLELGQALFGRQREKPVDQRRVDLYILCRFSHQGHKSIVPSTANSEASRSLSESVGRKKEIGRFTSSEGVRCNPRSQRP
jgi:hypothetical protein